MITIIQHCSVTKRILFEVHLWCQERLKENKNKNCSTEKEFEASRLLFHLNVRSNLVDRIHPRKELLGVSGAVLGSGRVLTRVWGPERRRLELGIGALDSPSSPLPVSYLRGRETGECILRRRRRVGDDGVAKDALLRITI